MLNKVALLVSTLFLPVLAFSDTNVKVTVFDAQRPNEILSVKEFPAGDERKSYFINLMSNQAMQFIEVSEDKSRCAQKLTPLGMELVFRSKKTSEYRYDISVTAMTSSIVNHRIVEGIQGCEQIAIYDIEKQAWTDSVGVIKGYPEVVMIGYDYKVVINLND